MTNNLGFMINYYRKSLNLTLEELGKKLNKSPSAVSRWISGDRSPMVDDLIRLTELFDVDLDTLLYGLPAQRAILQQPDNESFRKMALGVYAQDELTFIRLQNKSFDLRIPDNTLLALKPVAIDALKDSDIVCINDRDDYKVKSVYLDAANNRFILKSASSDPFELDYILSDEELTIILIGRVVCYIANF